LSVTLFHVFIFIQEYNSGGLIIMKLKTFILKFLKLVAIILFLLIILIVVIKK